MGVVADQSTLWSFSVFKVCDDKDNLLEGKDCKENYAKRATTMI